MKAKSLFVAAYLECALWSSTDENDQPLDREFSVSDIQGETLDKAIADCEKFQLDNEESLSDFYQTQTVEQAGHDFWLSRNGHGAGFFDREAEGAMDLQDAARAFGSADLYIGDDKNLYFF